MAENINVGTKIAGTSSQTNNATLEKYCYSDSEANCTTDGGLYQWDEAMQYASSCNGSGAPPNDACSSPVQGICPDGWHIPSHYEYVTLERGVCTSGTCATDFPYDTTTIGYRGTNEGTKLKAGGLSGFNVLLAGYRSLDGSFGGYNESSILWTSLDNGTNAWRRGIFLTAPTIYRTTLPKGDGFFVRCIEN